MQSYIVKNDEGIYALYANGGHIYQRKRIENGWEAAVTIAESVKGDFSVMRSPKGAPVILYRDGRGNVMVGCENKPHKMVLKNSSENSFPLGIYSILRERGIQLIYSKNYIKDGYLTEQHRREDGSWSKAFVFDKYVSENNMTRLVNIEDNYILFYVKNVPEQQLGYREIGRYGIDNFKMLYATGHKILDYSLAVTAEEIHLCLLVSTGRGGFNKLVYVKKDKNGISKSSVIYEGFIKGCHISIENSKIIIIFSAVRGNNRAVSYDMGNTFKRMESIESFNLGKIPFADYTPPNADGFVASELVWDMDTPFDVKYCPFIK